MRRIISTFVLLFLQIISVIFTSKDCRNSKILIKKDGFIFDPLILC
jgi:hypothetical protein